MTNRPQNIETSGSLAEARWKFLNLNRLPGRIEYRETGWLLGFSEEEVALLVSYEVLQPLGEPSKNGRKYLSTGQILKLSEDLDWVHKATKQIQDHWRQKNRKEVEKAATKIGRSPVI